jgi:hypothetical protein
MLPTDDEKWQIYEPLDNVTAYRSGAEPDESEPVVVVRMGEHTLSALLYQYAGDTRIGDAIMQYKAEIIRWAADGLDEQRYYCIGLMVEVTMAGDVLAAEVAFRRRTAGISDTLAA